MTSMPALSGPDFVPWLEKMRGAHPLWTDQNGVWHVFRYADVQAVLTAPDRFSSDLGRVLPFVDPEGLSGNLLWAEPDAHRRLRGIVGEAFTPKTVAGLRPRVAEIAYELVTAAPVGELDFVDAVAYPLPVIVIAELLGVSAEEREFFRECADRSLGIRVEPGQSQAELAATVAAAARDLAEYLRAQALRRRARPAGDLLSALTATSLTDTEVTGFATTLLTTGYVTTALLLGNILMCLRDNPSVATRLRADRSLVPAAVEEVLRHRPPIPQMYRVANEDCALACGVVPASAFMAVSILSANHDDRVFPDPDRFDIDRRPNKHLAFGYGVHRCLGAPLARLEAEIVLNTVFDAWSDIEVGEEIVTHDAEFYGAKRLPVTVRR